MSKVAHLIYSELERVFTDFHYFEKEFRCPNKYNLKDYSSSKRCPKVSKDISLDTKETCSNCWVDALENTYDNYGITLSIEGDIPARKISGIEKMASAMIDRHLSVEGSYCPHAYGFLSLYPTYSNRKNEGRTKCLVEFEVHSYERLMSKQTSCLECWALALNKDNEIAEIDNKLEIRKKKYQGIVNIINCLQKE